MQEQDSGLLPAHVLVDSDNLDAGETQSLEDTLQLALEHGEVAIHHGPIVWGMGAGPEENVAQYGPYAVRKGCRGPKLGFS